MKKWFLPLAMMFTQQLLAQHLTLQEAYDMARANYPLIKQKDLIRQTADISISNLQKGFLPQVNLSGQATYQSDVTKVEVTIPGFSIEPLNKDQYKLVADVSQLIYDGGMIREQKQLQQLNADVEEQRTEVELYKLNERINQVYLGIIYLDQQLKQVDLVKSDIETGIKKVEAQVMHGVAFKSNANMLKAELLKTEQRAIEIRANRKGLVDILGLLIGRSLPANQVFASPVQPEILFTSTIERPELKLFNDQSLLLGQQSRLINARNTPRASLFVQGGYGRPALNMLKNEFDFYYIGGVRLNWSLGGLYTKKKEKEIVGLSQRIVDLQKETFILNTNTQLEQQRAEILKQQQLIESDQEIIILRSSVTDAAKAQLENGVITPNDYLKEVNAEDLARQTLITHQVQLLQALINYRTISGINK